MGCGQQECARTDSDSFGWPIVYANASPCRCRAARRDVRRAHKRVRWPVPRRDAPTPTGPEGAKQARDSHVQLASQLQVPARAGRASKAQPATTSRVTVRARISIANEEIYGLIRFISLSKCSVSEAEIALSLAQLDCY